MLDDVASVTLHAAMTGLAQRERVTANNIANIETPGFTAQRVDFEDSLRAAVQAGDPGDAAVSTNQTTTDPGINGNNVDLGSEIVVDEQTALQTQLLAGALTSKYGLISTVLTG